MYPIIMVANFSGNVGKTTLTKSLLVPNIQELKVFAVEDINAGYDQGEAVTLSAEQTQAILEQVIEASFTRPVVVDVGASNVSNFFAALASYDNMQEFITCVMVPTEPSEKVQKDTLSTLTFLVDDLGFEPSKICLVLNKAPARIPTETVFGGLLSDAATKGVFSIGVIPENDTFQLSVALGLSIAQLSTMDPKEILAHAKTDGQDPKASVRTMLAAAAAKKLKSRLDTIYGALNEVVVAHSDS